MIRKEDVTVVIPCMNEEKTLPGITSALRRLGYRILVPIARKSTDGTLRVCDSRGIDHFVDSGGGKGVAIAESLERVGTPFVVFFDADGSHEIADITPLLQKLRDERADLAIGSRLMGGSMELYDGTTESFFRSFFTLCINQIINLRFGSRITDSQNGFRAGRTAALRSLKLRSWRFEVETEMVMKALHREMKVIEIPSREYHRASGSSGVSIIKDGWRYVWIVFSNLF